MGRKGQSKEGGHAGLQEDSAEERVACVWFHLSVSALATLFTVPGHLLFRVCVRVKRHVNLCEHMNVNIIVRCYYLGRNITIRAVDGHPGV